MMKWMFAVKEDLDAEGIRYNTNKIGKHLV